MLSKFAEKSAQKSSIFTIKANFERGLLIFFLLGLDLIFSNFLLGSVNSLHVSEISEDQYRIEWNEGHNLQEMYSVYGSVRPFFCLEDAHLIGYTSDHSIFVDGEYPYYWVVLDREGVLSVPSTVIDILEVKPKYAKNPYVSDEIWEKVSPYFLPQKHKIKKRLDKIFYQSGKRITANAHKLKKAGFAINPGNNWSGIVVVTHPKVPGYVIKIYTDDGREVHDWEKWIDRVNGATVIRNGIKRLEYQEIFKVPQKWIYPLPAEPSPKEGVDRKNFILIAEDMDIRKGRENQSSWKSVSRPQLNAVYRLCQEEGLKDSALPWNLPFSHDGKMSFVDTEYYHKWPIPFHRLTPFLHPNMQPYWEKLISQ